MRDDAELDAVELDDVCPLAHRLVPVSARRVDEQVDATERCVEREDLRALERAGVGNERQIVSDAAESRAQLDEHLAEALEVGRACRVDDVEILREAGVALEEHGDAADHDEVDATLGELPEKRSCVQLRRAAHGGELLR